MTEETMFGQPIENLGGQEPENENVYSVPPEDLEIPGSEYWINKDLSPTYRNIYELGNKARLLIRFAWWQEYKNTKYGDAKQPYRYVKRDPSLLFSWWRQQFPDIPFDTVEIGRRQNAIRIVDYIHRRYVLKDPSTLTELSTTQPQTQTIHEDVPQMEEDPQVEDEPQMEDEPHPKDHTPTVSAHDIDILMGLVPPSDPVHAVKDQPVVLDMAHYQVNHGVSREETYRVFHMEVTSDWITWARSSGEDLWTIISKKQVALHLQLHTNGRCNTPPKPIRKISSIRVPTRKQKKKPRHVPRKSSRTRQVSTILKDAVVDPETTKTIRRNTRNVGRL
jgi:hypothetical protein